MFGFGRKSYDQVLRRKECLFLVGDPGGTGVGDCTAVARGVRDQALLSQHGLPRGHAGCGVAPPPPTQTGARKLGWEACEVRLSLGRDSLPCFRATKPRDPRGDKQEKTKSNGRQLPWVVHEVGKVAGEAAE